MLALYCAAEMQKAPSFISGLQDPGAVPSRLSLTKSILHATNCTFVVMDVFSFPS